MPSVRRATNQRRSRDLPSLLPRYANSGRAHGSRHGLVPDYVNGHEERTRSFESVPATAAVRRVSKAAEGIRFRMVQRVLRAVGPLDGSLGFSLRTAPEHPHDVHVDLTTIWGNPDAMIAAVRDALATAGIDPGDFLEAARPAADNDDELLITCRAWVHVQIGRDASVLWDS